MSKFILAAFTAASLGAAAASTAHAGFTINQGWGCPSCGFKNGTALTGIADLEPAAVNAIHLPPGETIEFRQLRIADARETKSTPAPQAPTKPDRIENFQIQNSMGDL